jgi:hypothetical protein
MQITREIVDSLAFEIYDQVKQLSGDKVRERSAGIIALYLRSLLSEAGVEVKT